MSSVALIRRWISGVFRSGAAAFAADRKIMSSPWLMIQPNFIFGEPVFKFWCCATDEIYSFFRNHHKCPGEESLKFVDTPATWKMPLVGSSHGWLALYDNTEHHLYLLDPTTHRDIEFPLPPPMLGEQVHSAILSSSDESVGMMFVIFGSARRLACCSLRSHEWTLFGDEAAAYESVVYSSTYHRLFGITTAMKLEAWDVGGDSSRLDTDWVTEFDPIEGEGDSVLLTYLVCEEESGELYVVVRHAKDGRDWNTSPTFDFEVYKIDREGGRLVKMVDSLGGLAMFVGNNHPIAIKVKNDDNSGVKPNSIYFAEDRRSTLKSYSPIDDGIFDYQKGQIIHPLSPAFSCTLGDPIWFIPRRRRNT